MICKGYEGPAEVCIELRAYLPASIWETREMLRGIQQQIMEYYLTDVVTVQHLRAPLFECARGSPCTEGGTGLAPPLQTWQAGRGDPGPERHAHRPLRYLEHGGLAGMAV